MKKITQGLGVPAYQVVDPKMFKFRAETTSDVFKVLFRLYELDDHVYVSSVAMTTDPQFGEAEVTMRVVRRNPAGVDPYHVDMPLEDIRKAIGEIVDCHVISQSLNYAELYTGERYHPAYGSARREVKSYFWKP
jgi:hypothetical protein